ncbi:hypothetical protein C1646_671683 [Rhizophagus diaphanus]|nr:hypothetical protein C1646_671683 [Rhizophagus diaphanus] [Rhizophagus sp. MUCL 43196]
MACSKFFSGDLSELLNEVIQYFRYDYKTLHSCILVNRLWCQLAIPLLWEDPFSIKLPKNYHFIETYLSFLNEDDGWAFFFSSWACSILVDNVKMYIKYFSQ